MSVRVGRPYGDGRYVVAFDFDAEDCDNIADALPAPDGFIDELRTAAAEMRRREGEEPS